MNNQVLGCFYTVYIGSSKKISQIVALALSSNNKMIALSCQHEIIELWSNITNNIQCVICNYLSYNNIVTFFSDDISIVFASYSSNNTVKFCDIAKGN